MFEMPISLILHDTSRERLCDRVPAIWKRKGWKCEYIPVDSMQHSHFLVTDKFGYRVGAIVYKMVNGSVHVVLENPRGTCMSSWQIPYVGLIKAEIVVDALCRAIDVFETEEIPDPDDQEDES